MNAVTRRNDMYLEELKEMLEQRCGVTVSESTIWRTLNRVGFRMKEVHNCSVFAFRHHSSMKDNEACCGA